MKFLAPAVALFLTLANTLCSAIPADWTSPLEPLKISDNLYYVGSRDLAAYLAPVASCTSTARSTVMKCTRD